MRLLSILVLVVSSAAQAREQWPCAPAYAAEQPVLTRLSIDAEITQFRVMAQWQTAMDQLDTAQRQRDQRKREQQRADVLLGSRTMSTTQHAIVTQNYRMSEFRAEQMNSAAERARLEAEIAKRNVIAEGNPNLDLREEILDLRVATLKSELKNLESQLAGAQSNKVFFELGLSNGKKLFSTNAISQAELEQRQLRYDDAVAQVSSVKYQAQAAGDAIAGIELSRKKLLGQKK